MATKSFLPAVERFSQFLTQYGQQQMNLAERSYELNKQMEGQRFIADYGTRLRSAKTPEEMSQVLGEATQYAGQRGLQNHLQVISSLAGAQSNLIKLEQDKQKAQLYVDTLESNYADQTAPWKGQKAVKIADIVKDIKTSIADPTIQLEALEGITKSMNKSEAGITWDKYGNFQYNVGVKNPITGEVITTEQPVNVAKADGRYILDKNNNRILDEGEGYVPPEQAEQISRVESSLEQERKQDQRANLQYGRMNRKTVYDPKQNKYTTVLEDYQGRWFKVDKEGNKGEQISGEDLVEGTDFRAMNNFSASIVTQTRKVKNEELAKINALLKSSFKETLLKGKWKQYVSYAPNDLARMNPRIDEVQLNRLMGTISDKHKRGIVLDEYEKEIVDRGILSRWENDYWQARKNYTENYEGYVTQYNSRPVFDDMEPTEDYLTQSKSGVYKEGDLFVVYDENGERIGTSLTKEKADKIYNNNKKQTP